MLGMADDHYICNLANKDIIVHWYSLDVNPIRKRFYREPLLKSAPNIIDIHY